MISNNFKTLYARGLHMLLVPGSNAAANTPVSVATRAFAKKSKKADEPSDSEEPVAAAEPEPVKKAAPKKAAASSGAAASNLNLDRALFEPFSLGNIKKLDSTPDHAPPSKEDTIEGRYASVLFTCASQKSALYDVYEDLVYPRQLYSNSESFRLFTENAGVGEKEIKLLNKALQETAPFSDITFHFLTVLAENKRLMFIKDIAEKYEKLYAQFNKEEKITIISAEKLSSSEE